MCFQEYNIIYIKLNQCLLVVCVLLHTLFTTTGPRLRLRRRPRWQPAPTSPNRGETVAAFGPVARAERDTGVVPSHWRVLLA